MCGRASQTKKKLPANHRFASYINEADIEPVYNAGPGQNLAVQRTRGLFTLRQNRGGIWLSEHGSRKDGKIAFSERSEVLIIFLQNHKNKFTQYLVIHNTMCIFDALLHR